MPRAAIGTRFSIPTHRGRVEPAADGGRGQIIGQLVQLSRDIEPAHGGDFGTVHIRAGMCSRKLFQRQGSTHIQGVTRAESVSKRELVKNAGPG